jgi:hypothetical protein
MNMEKFRMDLFRKTKKVTPNMHVLSLEGPTSAFIELHQKLIHERIGFDALAQH